MLFLWMTIVWKIWIFEKGEIRNIMLGFWWVLCKKCYFEYPHEIRCKLLYIYIYVLNLIFIIFGKIWKNRKIYLMYNKSKGYQIHNSDATSIQNYAFDTPRFLHKCSVDIGKSSLSFISCVSKYIFVSCSFWVEA